MITFRRTDASDRDFISLVDLLNAELLPLEGDDHQFYAQYDKIDNIRYAIVAYNGLKPIGCGAIKNFDDSTMEVKRMYVDPSGRRSGIASMIIGELATWAEELGCNTLVLETGNNNPKATTLYRKLGFEVIPNYGQYESMEASICFRKQISK